MPDSGYAGQIAMTHGLITDGGFECCVFCWQPFGVNGQCESLPPNIGMGINYTRGSYCNAKTGEEYDHLNKDNAGVPLAHPNCRKEWKHAVRPDNEKPLTEWSE